MKRALAAGILLCALALYGILRVVGMTHELAFAIAVGAAVLAVCVIVLLAAFVLFAFVYTQGAAWFERTKRGWQ